MISKKKICELIETHNCTTALLLKDSLDNTLEAKNRRAKMMEEMDRFQVPPSVQSEMQPLVGVA